jgi:hypothetical protein
VSGALPNPNAVLTAFRASSVPGEFCQKPLHAETGQGSARPTWQSTADWVTGAMNAVSVQPQSWLLLPDVDAVKPSCRTESLALSSAYDYSAASSLARASDSWHSIRAVSTGARFVDGRRTHGDERSGSPPRAAGQRWSHDRVRASQVGIGRCRSVRASRGAPVCLSVLEEGGRTASFRR